MQFHKVDDINILNKIMRTFQTQHYSTQQQNMYK